MRMLLLAASLVLTVSQGVRAELPATLKADDVTLALNGSGARTKYLMQMYVAGLYLPQPSRDAAGIIAANNPMAIRLEITSGMVTQEKLLESLREGFHNATNGNVSPIQHAMEQFRQCFA
ncbi:MAG TPA: chalcone isomerase family protein, partial [Lacipirellulaceae bacterium]|nr:chalcone isomerase family protein [Lacipirellulaceae bacterium]